MRLIDADELKKCLRWCEVFRLSIDEIIKDYIDTAPTVEMTRGNCQTCKYYHPYCEQFTNKPRGDGYCVIARMTPEGMTTINCNDEFSCSDYEKANNKGATW